MRVLLSLLLIALVAHPTAADPAEAKGNASAEALAEAMHGATDDAPDGTPNSAEPSEPRRYTVDKWRPNERRCGRRGRRRFCDGPRRVPVSTGAARERRDRLGLGVLRAAAEAIRTKPRPEWMEELKVHGINAPSRSLVWPVDGGRFGRGVGRGRQRFRVHRGVDVTAETGTEVRAVAAGLVIYSDNGVPGYGNLLVVVHASGEVSSYAHLSEVHVAAGMFVGAGDVVALSGNTGISRGPHLHFEWRERGQMADPMRRMAAEYQPAWMREHFAAHPLRVRRPVK